GCCFPRARGSRRLPTAHAAGICALAATILPSPFRSQAIGSGHGNLGRSCLPAADFAGRRGDDTRGRLRGHSSPVARTRLAAYCRSLGGLGQALVIWYDKALSGVVWIAKP